MRISSLSKEITLHEFMNEPKALKAETIEKLELQFEENKGLRKAVEELLQKNSSQTTSMIQEKDEEIARTRDTVNKLAEK